MNWFLLGAESTDTAKKERKQERMVVALNTSLGSSEEQR